MMPPMPSYLEYNGHTNTVDSDYIRTYLSEWVLNWNTREKQKFRNIYMLKRSSPNFTVLGFSYGKPKIGTKPFIQEVNTTWIWTNEKSNTM